MSGSSGFEKYLNEVVFSHKSEIENQVRNYIIRNYDRRDINELITTLAKLELGYVSSIEVCCGDLKEFISQGWSINELRLNCWPYGTSITCNVMAPNGNDITINIYAKASQRLTKEEWQRLNQEVEKLKEELGEKIEEKRRENELKKLQERVKRLEEELNETRKENTELHEKLGRLKKYLRIVADRLGLDQIVNAIAEAKKEEDYAKIRDQILEELDMEEDYDP